MSELEIVVREGRRISSRNTERNTRLRTSLSLNYSSNSRPSMDLVFNRILFFLFPVLIKTNNTAGYCQSLGLFFKFYLHKQQ